MTSYQSKNWISFVSRPTPLLKRQLRNLAYLYLADISNLKISEVFVISEKGIATIFIRKNEDEINYQQVLKDYRNRIVDKYLAKFSKFTKNLEPGGRDAFERGILGHQKFTPIIIYSHYLERVLTEENQKLSRMSRKDKVRLRRLSKLNSKLRDKIVKVQDFDYYDKACEYLRKRGWDKSVDYYLIEEILANNKISSQKLEQRRKFYVLISKKNSTGIFTGKRALSILKRENFIKSIISMQNELRGFIACIGNASGWVKIVRNLADFRKDYQGKIVVSPMTIPQFVPYLKKVKAIITDEGGINCHAAIAAREFKIPCIVGTKIATKVLKDGDLVEVDANKGVVKILRRAK